jgi:hypothetical protein
MNKTVQRTDPCVDSPLSEKMQASGCGIGDLTDVEKAAFRRLPA